MALSQKDRDRLKELHGVILIEDEASRLWARFVEGDTTAANLQSLRDWLELYGRPLALYADKNALFQTPRSAEQIDNDGPAPPTDQDVEEDARDRDRSSSRSLS